MYLGMFLLGFILYGTLCTSWTGLTISFSMLGKFSAIFSSKYFSCPFFFYSSSGTPIIWKLVCLIRLFVRSLWLSSALFILFTLFCSSEVISTILSSSSLICCASDITEIKNTLEGINSRISEAEDKMVEITSEKQNKIKRMKRTEDSLGQRPLGQYETHQYSNNRGPRRRREKERVWKNFWRDYSWKFPQHGKGNSQSSPRGRKNPI